MILFGLLAVTVLNILAETEVRVLFCVSYVEDK
jgi:hypothetical protein